MSTPKLKNPPPMLYHVTRDKDLASILKLGLLTSRSRGARNVVYLADSRQLRARTVRHLLDKGHLTPGESVVLSIPSYRCLVLCRDGNGSWYTRLSIPPNFIRVDESLTFWANGLDL